MSNATLVTHQIPNPTFLQLLKLQHKSYGPQRIRLLMISSQEQTCHNCGSSFLKKILDQLSHSHQIFPIGSWTQKKKTLMNIATSPPSNL
jgi:hypothetical protein